MKRFLVIGFLFLFFFIFSTSVLARIPPGLILPETVVELVLFVGGCKDY